MKLNYVISSEIKDLESKPPAFLTQGCLVG